MDPIDRARREWLDRECKRDMELAKLGRAAARLRAQLVREREAPRTHAPRPGNLRTLCGKRVTLRRSEGTCPQSHLSAEPTCRNCRDRLEALAPEQATS